MLIVSTDGSGMRRLTHNSAAGKEVPVCLLDNNTLLFQADIMPDASFWYVPLGVGLPRPTHLTTKHVARPGSTTLRRWLLLPSQW